MGLTTAMYTGLTGLNANQSRIQTIGHNIANVNTTAFKGSRMLFQTQVSQLLSAGHGPTDISGGVNPLQIGLGVNIGATQRLFTPGSIETTGINSDLAIEGAGLFAVRRPSGEQLYTRDGSFSLDSENRLVTADGDRVLGFSVDGDFNIIPTVLSDLRIPVGTLSLARSTSRVIMDGDLSAVGTVATQGSRHTTQAMVDGDGVVAGGATPLTDLRSAAAPGVALFNPGERITVAGVSKGQRELPPQTFVVGQTGSTLQDFAGWLETALGINRSAGLPGTPGVSIVDGALVIEGNAGEFNGLAFDNTDISTSNPSAPLPFTFAQLQSANGAGVTTAFIVYDSLGTPLVANLTFALEDLTPAGPVWRFYVESADDGDGSRVVGTGLVSFDTLGNFRGASGNQVQISRAGTGAGTPLDFTLDFSGVHGLSTAASEIVMADQDGFPPGTLTNFTIDSDGVINGTFSNGLTRTLGQVAVAVFSNPEGLLAESDNLYRAGPNSGNPTITPPGLFGAGRIMSGALELSNVDLGREFIGLITSSTGFQASSRVISTSSDLLDQLLLIVR